MWSHPSLTQVLPFPKSVDFEVFVQGLPGLTAIVEDGREVPAHFDQPGDVAGGQVSNLGQRINA